MEKCCKLTHGTLFVTDTVYCVYYNDVLNYFDMYPTSRL